jgi:Xaa-Pro aminopeptidase
MHQDNLDRFQERLRSQEIQAALLSNPSTITWLTGYAPPIETGPSPFEGGPALGWWQDGELTLLLSSDEAPAAQAAAVAVRDYVGYSAVEPLEGAQRQAAALHTLLKEAAPPRGLVGVEVHFLTAPQLNAMQAALPSATLRPIDGAFDGLRAVKSAQELGKIRAALALSDMAQAEMKKLITAGSSELALWGQIKARLELHAGTRLPILADLVAGARSAEIGGPPGSYVLLDGDPLIFDVVPRLNGYWGDNAATHFVGAASPELAKMRDVVWDTLRRGIEMVRPGVVASDLDQSMRSLIRAASYEPYPHHTGHGIGVTYHEEPRIVPYNHTHLQPGMVIALEPGIYAPGTGGVRLEHIVLVTVDGCEVLTHHLPL